MSKKNTSDTLFFLGLVVGISGIVYLFVKDNPFYLGGLIGTSGTLVFNRIAFGE